MEYKEIFNAIKKGITFFLPYNALNLVFLFVIQHGSSKIYGDGSGGFFESILNPIIGYMAIGLFFVAFIISLLMLVMPEEIMPCIFPATLIFILFLLMISALSMIGSACSNSTGYCQNWSFSFG